MENMKVSVNNFAVLLGALFFICGCAKREVSVQEYIVWVEDEKNGLKVRKEVGEFIFELQYKPSAYLAAVQNRKKNRINKAQVDAYSGLDHYNLKILSKDSDVEMLRVGAGSEGVYQERINYFSFDAQKDLKLTIGADSYECILYHFERSYDLAPFCNLVLGFPGKKPSEKQQNRLITFDDKMLGVGKINLLIKANDIESIPLLKIDP